MGSCDFLMPVGGVRFIRDQSDSLRTALVLTLCGLPTVLVATIVLIAAGHNMLGVSMSLATGKLVAEMLGGAVPHLDASRYTLAQFSRRKE